MQPSRLQTIIEFVLDNLFDILTIVIAGYLVIHYQVYPPRQNDITEIVTWILAVLGLIAVSGLWERNRKLHRIEKLSEEGRNLTLRYLSKRVYADDFFSSGQPLTAKDLSTANTIYFVGKVLARSSREFLYILGQRLVAGANIRFVVLDPESEELLKQAELQSFNAPIGYYRETINTTETVIKALAKTQNSKGKVEIGYLPYIPSFGLILLDPNESHGVCYVEIYQHRSAEPHPAFELYAKDDPHWYLFFRNQFEKIWESCRVKSLP